MKSAPDRIDPQERYRLTGQFDQNAFEEDLTDFPEYFDANGWPLFGDYDTYALEHPISGLSWIDQPRIPARAEKDPTYEFWYYLAEELNTALAVMQEGRILPRNHSPAKTRRVEAVYKVGTSRKSMVAENVTYLHRWVLPRLTSLLRDRRAGPELTLLWGEFRAITESLGIAIDREKQWQAQAEEGAKSQKNAQLKFYLHFIRHHSEQGGLTTRAANKELVKLVLGITEGTHQAPPGFEDKDWWRAFLYTPQTDAAGEVTKSARTSPLAEAFIRARSNPQRAALLASPPEEAPEIPPLDLDAYRRSD
jgi:hypothetical protein